MSIHDSTDSTSSKQELIEASKTILNSADGFFKLHPAYTRYLKGHAASIVLSVIINHFQLKIHPLSNDYTRIIKDRLWFCCPAADIIYETWMTKDRQQACINLLVEEGFIEVDYRWGRLMWVRIRHEKLKEIEHLGKERFRNRNKTEDPNEENHTQNGSGTMGGKSPHRKRGNPPTGSGEIPPPILKKKEEEKKKTEEPAVAGVPSRKTSFLNGTYTNKFSNALLQIWCEELNTYINNRDSTSKRLDGSWLSRLKKSLQESKYITSQIDAVLQFLQKGIADPSGKRPKPNGPEHFVKSMPILLRCLAKDNPLQEDTSTPPSPEVQKTLDRIADLQWPDPSTLHAAVRLSVSNYHEFVARVVKLEKRLKEGKVKSLSVQQLKILDLFLIALSGNCLMHATSIVMEEWFRDVYNHRITWENWDGKIIRDAWDINTERTKKKLGKWAMRSTGSTDILKTFMEVL